jgi:hypothetical protein
MHLEQPKAIAFTQLTERNERRARIVPQACVRIEARDKLEIVRDRGRYLAPPPQSSHPFRELAALGRPFAFERVEAGARMGVDDPERRVLEREVAQQAQQDEVLEHVGVVAGVEGMAVTEHGISFGLRPAHAPV